METVFWLITLIVFNIAIVTVRSQGLSGVNCRTTRFVPTANIRITNSVYSTMSVSRDIFCASACLLDDYCVSYNLRVTSSPDVLQCELINDVIYSTSDTNSTLFAFDSSTYLPSDPDYVAMPKAGFSVYNNKGLPTPTQVVLDFANNNINLQEAFDNNANKFIVPKYGLYWQHIHSYSDDNAFCNVSIIGSAGYPQIGVYRNFPFDGAPGPKYYDILSREDIRWLPTRSQLFVNSNLGMGDQANAASFIRSAWSVFKIDELMSPLVAFNVYQDSTITTPAVKPVPFNNVVINEGGGWNADGSSTFTAPVSGVYVFSFGTAGKGNTSPIFTLALSNSSASYSAKYMNPSAVNTNNIHMSHRTVLVALNKSESVAILGLSTQSSGEIYQMSSFKGFLYSPNHGIQVAWAALKVGSDVGSANANLDLTFPNVAVNVGNAWNSDHATIPVWAPGIYYLEFGIMLKTGGGVMIQLYINSQAVAIAGINNYVGSIVYRDASHMVALNAGDRVSVRVTLGSYDVGTGICGFYLYPQ